MDVGYIRLIGSYGELDIDMAGRLAAFVDGIEVRFPSR